MSQAVKPKLELDKTRESLVALGLDHGAEVLSDLLTQAAKDFFRLDDLLFAMKRDADVPPRRLRAKKYMNTALLIIDEVGFQQLTRQEAALLFRLVSWRYQKGSTIITTNKSVKDWPEVLAGDEVMTTALLDRLLHRCHVFNIKGRSYRLREHEPQMKG